MWDEDFLPEASNGFSFSFDELYYCEWPLTEMTQERRTSEYVPVRDVPSQQVPVPFAGTAVGYGSHPPDEDLNRNPAPAPPASRSRTVYGMGGESKKNAPHLDDHYPYENGPSFMCFSNHFRNPITGRMPRSEDLYKAFRILVEGMSVERTAKRRLPVMYKWLDDHWDTIGTTALAVFSRQLAH